MQGEEKGKPIINPSGRPTGRNETVNGTDNATTGFFILRPAKALQLSQP